MNRNFLEEAITSFDKALEIKPKDVNIWCNRGKALQELGRFEEAITSFDRAISLKPDDPYIWCNKGDTLQKLGRFEEAIASCDKAIKLKTDYPEAWFIRGKTLQNLGLTDEAIASYDKALRIRSDYPEARKDRDSLLLPLLPSEKGVNYIKLRDLLAAEKWKDADEETARVIGFSGGEVTHSEDIVKIPCEDLRTINKLWLYYSKGHFGFSVQNKIYKSIGGTEKWIKFCKRVGWKLQEPKTDHSCDDSFWDTELIFNLNAPSGHLPALRSLIKKGKTPYYIWEWSGPRIFYLHCPIAYLKLLDHIDVCNL
jgi:tetratricopeptide (TPR) repeat protein